jgi:hypothetical protein
MTVLAALAGFLAATAYAHRPAPPANPPSPGPAGLAALMAGPPPPDDRPAYFRGTWYAAMIATAAAVKLLDWLMRS